MSTRSTERGRWAAIGGGRLALWAAVTLTVGLAAGVTWAGQWTTYTDATFVGGLAADGDDVWAGTDGGLLHWSIAAGTYVKLTTTEGLADQRVLDTFVDATGALWVATVNGVQKLQGGSWTTYNTANSPLPSNVVNAIAQDLDGRMWFGTGYGCASFDGSVWQVFTDLGGGATNVAVRGIGVDSSNRVWTANNPRAYGAVGGVSRYDGSTWTRFDPSPGSIGQYFLCLAVDGADHVWAGSWTNWLFGYDGSTWTQYTSGNSGLVGQQVEAVEVVGTSTWVANHAANVTQPSQTAVSKFDGATWTTYSAANSGLPYNLVYSISATGGVLYFGTSASGTASLDGTTWHYYQTTNDPHSNWIVDVEQGAVGASPPALYFATDHDGAAIFDGVTWSSYTTDNSGLGDDFLIDLHIRDGILWAGSSFTGLWKLDGTTWTSYNTSNSGLLGNGIQSVASDSLGNLWLGTSGWNGPMGQTGALAKFDGASFTNYTMDSSGLIWDEMIQVAVDAADVIWVGTLAGVSRFDGVSSWTDYTTANGLVNDQVNAIAFDMAGSVWFATQGGVSRFDGVSSWMSYTTADGLPSNEVRDIRASAFGGIWVATAAGAAMLHGETWTAYDQTQGLCDDDLTTVGVAGDATVWFGSYESGLSSFSQGLLFADDFESGGLTAWSESVP